MLNSALFDIRLFFEFGMMSPYLREVCSFERQSGLEEMI